MRSHAFVIEENGTYKFTVWVQNDIISDYKLKSGERLIETPIPHSIQKPRWTGSEWEEAATLEKIEAVQPESISPQPSEMDIVLLALAEIYEKMSGGAA